MDASLSPERASHDDAPRYHVHLSVLLGLLIAFFYIDSFLRDASIGRFVLLNLIFVAMTLGLIAVSNGAVARGVRLRDVLLAVVGALMTAFLARELHLGFVLAASIMGVLAALGVRFMKGGRDSDAAAVFCGAFVGMTSDLVLLGPLWLVLAGALAGAVWSSVRDAWIGVGGKMGTMAFAGVLATVVIAVLTGAQSRPITLPSLQLSEQLIVVLIAIPASLLTHWLSYHRQWGVVLGSALPSMVVTGALVAVTAITGINTAVEAAAWLGASFVGMTAPTRLSFRWMLPLMAVVFGVLAVLFTSNLAGLGGDLGATASASVLAVMGMTFAVNRVRHPATHGHLAH